MNTVSKFLAQSGICSRRKAVECVQQGLVTVNHAVIKEPFFALQENDVVRYKKKVVSVLQEHHYIIVNKPRGVVTTCADPQGRKTVLNLVPYDIKGLFPVGRLDVQTSGLLLLTNDGALANQLIHPKFGVSKTYMVVLQKPLIMRDKEAIEKGIYLSDGKATVDSISFFKDAPRTIVEISLHSGKNKIIRRIFGHLGYHVKKLERIAFGKLHKKGLREGACRQISKSDII